MSGNRRVKTILGSYLQVAGYAASLIGTRLEMLGKRAAPQSFLQTDGHDWTGPLGEPVALDRDGAASWAMNHLNDPESIVPNCAYFVSDSLRLGGGLTETEEWRPGVRAGRVRRSRRIALHPPYGCVGDFVIAMQRSGRARLFGVDTLNNVLDGARLGDVIVYNWDGRGKYQHVAIVTQVTDTATYVSQQTPTQLNRQWNRYGNGRWIASASLLRFATADSPEATRSA